MCVCVRYNIHSSTCTAVLLPLVMMMMVVVVLVVLETGVSGCCRRH